MKASVAEIGLLGDFFPVKFMGVKFVRYTYISCICISLLHALFARKKIAAVCVLFVFSMCLSNLNYEKWVPSWWLNHPSIPQVGVKIKNI